MPRTSPKFFHPSPLILAAEFFSVKLLSPQQRDIKNYKVTATRDVKKLLSPQQGTLKGEERNFQRPCPLKALSLLAYLAAAPCLNLPSRSSCLTRLAARRRSSLSSPEAPGRPRPKKERSLPKAVKFLSDNAQRKPQQFVARRLLSHLQYPVHR